MSVGMDRETGRVITGFDHVLQSIGDIFSTELAERPLREWYGFPGLRLLGEPMNEANILRFFQDLVSALEVIELNGLPREPRFKIIQIVPLAAERSGNLSCRLEGEYRPRGHLGDFTPATVKRILISGAGDKFSAIDGGVV